VLIPGPDPANQPTAATDKHAVHLHDVVRELDEPELVVDPVHEPADAQRVDAVRARLERTPHLDPVAGIAVPGLRPAEAAVEAARTGR
jgi:hypothetical protein